MRWLAAVALLASLVLAGCQSTSQTRKDDEKPSAANGWRGTHNYSTGL